MAEPSEQMIADLLAERGKTHGLWPEHARIVQLTKRLWQDQRGWSGLSEHQRETLDMIAHKVGRILAGDPNHQDHWDDIAGYAVLSSREIGRYK